MIQHPCEEFPRQDNSKNRKNETASYVEVSDVSMSLVTSRRFPRLAVHFSDWRRFRGKI
jgi:hypothetical protein